MQVTLWSHADILVFFNKDNELIAFQITPESCEKLGVSMPVTPYPAAAKKTLIMPGMYLKIAYSKVNITDKMGELIDFEMNDSMSTFKGKCMESIYKAKDI